MAVLSTASTPLRQHTSALLCERGQIPGPPPTYFVTPLQEVTLTSPVLDRKASGRLLAGNVWPSLHVWLRLLAALPPPDCIVTWKAS